MPKLVFRCAGEIVQPPEGWVRVSSWKLDECVKPCAVCGEPYWRSRYYDRPEWERKQCHRECQSKMITIVCNQRKPRPKTEAEIIEQQRREFLMDEEQSKINLRLDAIIYQRYMSNLSHDFCQKFMPQISWLLEA